MRDRPVAEPFALRHTHSTLKGQISMNPAEFQPSFVASDRGQTLGLDGSVTGIAVFKIDECLVKVCSSVYFLTTVITDTFLTLCFISYRDHTED